jgi:hypothetical protein
MKNKLFATLLTSFLLTACTFFPGKFQERDFPSPASTKAEPNDKIPCAPENWTIAITAVEQRDLGDGTKLILIKLGIENNDSLWGSVNGPANETRQSVSLTTKDGSVYEPVEGSQSIPTEQLPDRIQIMLAETGRIETPSMPPGFIAVGETIDGEPFSYNFAFRIPKSQVPEGISIGGVEVECIFPRNVGEIGKPFRRHKFIQLPVKSYNLETDVTEVREAPSARRYPNLVGAELVTPDWKETLFITNVSRDGNIIEVTFDFTNFSSRPISPSFNGYIMGSSRMFICQKSCDGQKTHGPVEAGRTAQDLTWTFTLPRDETNLTFVYVHGGNVDLNEAYRLNLE